MPLKYSNASPSEILIEIILMVMPSALREKGTCVVDAISLTTASIQQDVQRMNAIANNAANVMTSGFKREYLSASAQFDSSLFAPASLGNSPATIPILQSRTDTKPGIARQTGNPLDLALLGEGYFEVNTGSGLAYTRQGTFKLDNTGRLVNQSGFPVTGMDGEIFLNSATPTIDREGKVFELGKQIAQLKVVNFNSPQALASIGGGLYLQNVEAAKLEMLSPRMAQGHLESSNVDSTQEMVRMLETYRHFETSHRVLQAYDDLSDKTFKSLGQF